MSTKTEPNRKTYDLEFKNQAVPLVLTSGRPLTQIARELGVSPWNLRAWRERLQPQLLVPSDRGGQYARRETRAFLARHGWEASLSRPGHPYDNAWMESASGRIQSEVLDHTVPADHATAKRQLFVGSESYYNQRRRHSSLGYQSPVSFEAQFMKN